MKIRPLSIAFLASSLLFSAARAQDEPLKISSPVPFRNIARLRRLNAKAQGFNARAVYPTFRAQTRLTRFVNAKVGHDQRAAYTAWVKAARQQIGEGFTPPGPLQYQSVPSLISYSPSRLISLSFDCYQYMGGAHGIGLTLSRNFGMVGGRPKELSLGDFFAPGTAYRAHVADQIFAKLKKNPAASWVHDGGVKSLTNAQFNNFFVARDGLTWLFNPYEMGPFANGQVEVKLSVKELGPRFLELKVGN